jgi:hypothetical protein
MNNNDIKIAVEKLTTDYWMRKACEATIDSKSNMSLDKIYQCKHSPMRTQIFYVSMINIPTFVATHLVRHVTIVPFVKSNRSDRRSKDETVIQINSVDDALEFGRNVPVRMDFIANAESLISIANKRLCYKASKETREVVEQIKLHMQLVDYDLAFRMVPNCIAYRNCFELKSCGFFEKFLDKNPELCHKESLVDVNSWFKAFNKNL